MTQPAPPTISPDDPLVKAVEQALIEHEISESWRFCACSPVDEEEGTTEPLPVSGETHLAQVATEAALTYLQPIVGP